MRVTLEPAPHQSLFTLLPKHSRFFAPFEMLWSFAASNRWAALSHGMRHSFHRNKNHVSKLETTQLSIYPYKIESTSGGKKLLEFDFNHPRCAGFNILDILFVNLKWRGQHFCQRILMTRPLSGTSCPWQIGSNYWVQHVCCRLPQHVESFRDS